MSTNWKSLTKEAVHSFDAADVRGMWNVDFRRATRVLLSDHPDQNPPEPRRWKRALRRTNAIVFGLAKRLAPPRRLVFAVALVLTILAFMFGNGTEGWPFAALLVCVLALMVLLAMELVDKLHFKDELVMARDLQAQLVPRPLPEIGGFELAGESRVANTGGGDLYVFEALPGGRVAVLFGDASGHGMAAGLVMAVTHAAFRTQLGIDPSPVAMASSLNRVLCETGSARSFFAGICGFLDADGSFSAVVPGDPPVPQIALEGRVVERVGKGSYPLGIRKNT